MSYIPPENLEVVWSSRADAWRKYSEVVRDRVSGYPAYLRGLGIADLGSGKAEELVRQWCLRWERYQPGNPESSMPPAERGQGLFITGSPGVGKTRMAVSAARHVSGLGWTAKFIRAQDYYSLGIQAMHTRDPDERELLQGGFDCYAAGWDGWRLMVLDDLGREHITATGWTERVIENLIRARYSAAAPTIITTNLTDTQIEKRYGTAFLDYVTEAFWRVDVSRTRTSYRPQVLK